MKAYVFFIKTNYEGVSLSSVVLFNPSIQYTNVLLIEIPNNFPHLEYDGHMQFNEIRDPMASKSLSLSP